MVSIIVYILFSPLLDAVILIVGMGGLETAVFLISDTISTENTAYNRGGRLVVIGGGTTRPRPPLLLLLSAVVGLKLSCLVVHVVFLEL